MRFIAPSLLPLCLSVFVFKHHGHKDTKALRLLSFRHAVTGLVVSPDRIRSWVWGLLCMAKAASAGCGSCHAVERRPECSDGFVLGGPAVCTRRASTSGRYGEGSGTHE